MADDTFDLATNIEPKMDITSTSTAKISPETFLLTDDGGITLNKDSLMPFDEEENTNVSRWESRATVGAGVVMNELNDNGYTIPSVINLSAKNDDTQYHAGYQPRDPNGDWEITRAFDFTSGNGLFEGQAQYEPHMRPTLWSRLKGMWQKHQGHSDGNSIEVQPMPIQSSTEPYTDEDKLTSLLTSCKALMASQDREDREAAGNRISFNIGLGLLAVVIFNVSMWLSLPSLSQPLGCEFDVLGCNYDEKMPHRVALIVQHTLDDEPSLQVIDTTGREQVQQQQQKTLRDHMLSSRRDDNINMDGVINNNSGNGDEKSITQPPVMVGYNNNNINHHMRQQAMVNPPHHPRMDMEYDPEQQEQQQLPEEYNDVELNNAEESAHVPRDVRKDEQDYIDMQPPPSAMLQSHSQNNQYVKGSGPIHAAKLRRHKDDSRNSILIE